MSGDRVLGNRCDGHKLGFQKITKFASSTTLLYLTMTNNMSGTAETSLFDHSTSIRLMRVLVIPCACVLMCVRTRGVIRCVARPPRPRGAFRPRARPGSRPPGQVTDSLPISACQAQVARDSPGKVWGNRPPPHHWIIMQCYTADIYPCDKHCSTNARRSHRYQIDRALHIGDTHENEGFAWTDTGGGGAEWDDGSTL